MGFSSALIGSAMAFDFTMFHEIAPTLKGADLSKAMETALLQQNIYTEYLEEVVCYSKKKKVLMDMKRNESVGFVHNIAVLFCFKKIANNIVKRRMGLCS